MNKNLKMVRVVLLILSVLSLIILDVKMIEQISKKNQESYWQQNYTSKAQKVKKVNIKTEFQAVGKYVNKIQIWTVQTNQPRGNISWKVEDAQGKDILNKQKINISKVWDKETNRINLDISGISYEPGSTYFIITNFELKNAVEIVTDEKGVMYTQVYKADYQWLLYIGIAVVNIFIAASLFFYWRWGWNNKIFLFITVTIGVFAVFFTAPFSRDDEFRHFVRAYDLSCGGKEGYSAKPQKDVVGNVFQNEKGEAQLIQIPKEISELRLVNYENNYNQISYQSEINTGLCLQKLLSIFAQPEMKGKAEVAEAATAGKGLENYWPQVIMIKLGMITGIRSGFWYYLAVIGQVVAASLFLGGAFYLAKNHENLITVCSLVSVVTLLRASANPDGLMIAEIIFSLAIILHLRETQMNLICKNGILLLAFYVIIVYQIYCMKMPYTLVCLGFIFLLRKENFLWLPWEKIKKYKIQIVVTAIGVCTIAVIYLVIIRKGDIFLSVLYQFLPQTYVEYILTHFKEFMVMYIGKGKALAKETFIALHGEYYISYGMLAFLILLFSQKRFSAIYKCYQVFLYLCMLGIIVLVGYTLTPPDYGQIWGITYRYMLPALPVLGLAIPFGSEKTEYYVNQIYPIVLITMVFASSLIWLGI